MEEIKLALSAPMSEYQKYIYALEDMHGWLDVDLVHNCFLMGEEVGELFKAIRKYQKYFDEHDRQKEQSSESKKSQVAEEIIDVMNYLIAIANRLDINIEESFREKNARNQKREWK